MSHSSAVGDPWMSRKDGVVFQVVRYYHCRSPCQSGQPRFFVLLSFTPATTLLFHSARVLFLTSCDFNLFLAELCLAHELPPKSSFSDGSAFGTSDLLCCCISQWHQTYNTRHDVRIMHRVGGTVTSRFWSNWLGIRVLRFRGVLR